MVEPIYSPIGIKDISTPRLNNIMPKIIKNALAKNSATPLQSGIGATVKCRIRTITIIGIMRNADSFSFSNSNFAISSPRPLYN